MRELEGGFELQRTSLTGLGRPSFRPWASQTSQSNEVNGGVSREGDPQYIKMSYRNIATINQYISNGKSVHVQN